MFSHFKGLSEKLVYCTASEKKDGERGRGGLLTTFGGGVQKRRQQKRVGFFQCNPSMHCRQDAETSCTVLEFLNNL